MTIYAKNVILCNYLISWLTEIVGILVKRCVASFRFVFLNSSNLSDHYAWFRTVFDVIISPSQYLKQMLTDEIALNVQKVKSHEQY